MLYTIAPQTAHGHLRSSTAAVQHDEFEAPHRLRTVIRLQLTRVQESLSRSEARSFVHVAAG